MISPLLKLIGSDRVIESIYIPLKHSHLLLVAFSIIFFIARGSARLLGKNWQNKLVIKISAHSIDSLLLITGVLLMFSTHQFPGAQPWLTTKLILLIGYIVFGIKTMKSNSKMQQRSYFATAIVCVLLMVTIARTHHPLGLFSLL